LNRICSINIQQQNSGNINIRELNEELKQLSDDDFIYKWGYKDSKIGEMIDDAAT
jgi:hypothetical protein